MPAFLHQRSCVTVTQRLVCWTGLGPAAQRETLREWWRRIVFNALIRNSNGHPHNHGLLCNDMPAQRRRLPPAFDLVAQRGSSANRADLQAAAHYAYHDEATADWYESTRAVVRQYW